MSQTAQQRNKALVLEAFDALFNRRDVAAAERFWSPRYIQHSAHSAPGREGLFTLVRGLPATLEYEPGVIVADGNLVIVHGRFLGFGAPANWIVSDILRIEDGVLAEHWDIIQDEATEEQGADVWLVISCLYLVGEDNWIACAVKRGPYTCGYPPSTGGATAGGES
jgi:predicted SnoaL-like aldol condensation-catalyzing enzyme